MFLGECLFSMPVARCSSWHLKGLLDCYSQREIQRAEQLIIGVLRHQKNCVCSANCDHLEDMIHGT